MAFKLRFAGYWTLADQDKGNSNPGKGNSVCKGLEAGKKFGYLWRWKKARVAGAQGKRDPGEAGKVVQTRTCSA